MASMRAKLALSTLCENPGRRTGLSTLFPEFIAHSRRLFPDVSWIVFVGRDSPWPEGDPAVEVCRDFPSNERRLPRLLADHLRVPREALRRGAAALLTVGFFPLRPQGLPIAMHVLAASHLRGGGGPRHAYRRQAVARGLERSALVIVNSSWMRSQLGPARCPMIVSPEGLDHDQFQAVGASGAKGVSGRYLLWASNLYPYKRIELALAAYAGLPAATRSEFPLLVAGGDWDGGRARAENEAARLGIRENVRFLGWVADEELPALYRGAQAHILSTSEETFGRSVLEAMACGCLNVVQDLPVLREVAGGTAIYVDYTDPAAAASVLQQACAGAAGREQLVAAGIKRAADFSYERLARERVGAILSAIGLGASRERVRTW
jgi:glycosyltransferase involved in cell wall biosynthesis